MTVTFEGWARVELFGHRVVFGHVSEVTMFGATFARIEAPTDPPTVEYKSAQAIYGLTASTEEICRRANQPWKPRPALSAAQEDDHGGDYEDDDLDDLSDEQELADGPVDSDTPQGVA